MYIYLWIYMQMLSVVWRRSISSNQTRTRASAQTIMGYGPQYSLSSL
jgi:hypothetical protein